MHDRASSAGTDPRNVVETFRLKEGMHIIGSLEQGVTVYSQQVRAHNLTWSLWELEKAGQIRLKKVAIVGGGIGGLTAAACLLSLFGKEVSLTLFEQLWDLCPLQQGSDNRWLHPRIYEWPAPGSRAPGASLPVLNWSEGRASDVARTILRQFSRTCQKFADSEGRLTVYLGLRHLQIDPAANEISWIGTKAIRTGDFFHLDGKEGAAAKFDIIILAPGFGLETADPNYDTEPYWRNEQIGQSSLDGTQRACLISGFGDGALVDLCRLTIERFRQDTILYDLFKERLEEVENRLFEERGRRPDGNAFDYFRAIENEVLGDAKAELAQRLRKDTRVTLHIAGSKGEIRSFSQIFTYRTSFLNRLLLFLLYRCGAFGISLDEIATAVARNGVSAGNVICRHGAKTLAHVESMFSDKTIISEQLKEMKARQGQTARRLWTLGTFPPAN